MKRKTIEKELKAVIKKLVASTDDKEIKDIFMNHTIITGGCIASMLLREDVNDYDLYFDSLESATKIAEYYTQETAFRVSNEDWFRKQEDMCDDVALHIVDDRLRIYIPSSGILFRNPKKDYEPKVFTANAISLKGKVQLILRFYGDPNTIHRNYDFVHCTNYFYKGVVHLNTDALESLITKELRYMGSKYPVCSIIRIRKFLKRGWQINAGQILKMIMQVNSLDLSDTEVLEDQLVGVDSLYFRTLIEKLHNTKNLSGEDVNNYVISLVDDIFDSEPDIPEVKDVETDEDTRLEE